MRLGSFQLPNGASLSYAEYGTSTGNPVLLFHGLVGSICSEGMEESLCGLPVRVIALARPGYGASDYFDMDCVADWGRLLAEFWDHLELWSFDIVGISAGAPYAYSLAALYPDRIGTLYINSGIPAVCFPNVLAQYPAQDAALYRAFRGMSRQEAGQALYDSYLPLFPEAALQSRDFGTLWVVISGISVRKPSSRKHLGDLSCLRCGVRLYCFMEQPIPRCLTVPWRRLPKNFLMPALSNWRGKSTHPPQSRTD